MDYVAIGGPMNGQTVKHRRTLVGLTTFFLEETTGDISRYVVARGRRLVFASTTGRTPPHRLPGEGAGLKRRHHATIENESPE
jgi:hypothetical protein